MQDRATVSGAGYRPSERKAVVSEPLYEGCRALHPNEMAAVLVSLRRKTGHELCERFFNAKEKLEQLFGASIDVVEQSNGSLSVALRYSFITLDRAIDENMACLSGNAGFNLCLRSVPHPGEPYEALVNSIPLPLYESVDHRGRKTQLYGLRDAVYYEPCTEREYVITERPYHSAELYKAAESAEALLSLLKRLRPEMREDVPDNVIDFSKAKSNRPPPPSGVFEKPEISDAAIPKVS